MDGARARAADPVSATVSPEAPPAQDPGAVRIGVLDRDRGLDTLIRRVTTGPATIEHLRAVEETACGGPYHLLVLDETALTAAGPATCRQLRRGYDGGIMLVSGTVDAHDRARALHAGADDVISRPFLVAELGARLAAVLRRYRLDTPERLRGRRVRVGGLQVDLVARRASTPDGPLPLTATEFQILGVLLRTPGLVPRERIVAEVWNVASLGSSRALDVHMAALRGKLAGVVAVRTVRGQGYRLDPVA